MKPDHVVRRRLAPSLCTPERLDPARKQAGAAAEVKRNSNRASRSAACERRLASGGPKPYPPTRAAASRPRRLSQPSSHSLIERCAAQGLQPTQAPHPAGTSERPARRPRSESSPSSREEEHCHQPPELPSRPAVLSQEPERQPARRRPKLFARVLLTLSDVRGSGLPRRHHGDWRRPPAAGRRLRHSTRARERREEHPRVPRRKHHGEQVA